jgi:hypothetical protein
VSALCSALDEFVGEDLAALPDARVEEDFAELHQASEALEVERLRRLAEINRRRSFERDGYLPTGSWRCHRFRMAFSQATHLLRTAKALRNMPRTEAALSSGEVSSSAVRLLVSAHETNPEQFAEAEDMLVDAARVLSFRDLHRAVAYWRQAADRRDGPEERYIKRHLHVSPTVFGTVRVDGDLDPETGQSVITALRAVQDADAKTAVGEDYRNPGQRRADALGELCRQWLDRSDRPQAGGERPHVVVTVDVPALQVKPLGRAEMDDVGPIHPDAARRWACDASIVRVIARGRSEPVDVGRRTPVVPAPLRRAVIVRDRHCRFPGCDRPQSWCDAHHVRHWADGGSTSLANLILLCRRHHRLVHQGFGLAIERGEAVFSRPDGSVLQDRAPP